MFVYHSCAMPERVSQDDFTKTYQNEGRERAEVQGQLCVRFQQPAPLLPGEHGSIGWREVDNGTVPALANSPAATLTRHPQRDITSRTITSALPLMVNPAQAAAVAARPVTDVTMEKPTKGPGTPPTKFVSKPHSQDDSAMQSSSMRSSSTNSSLTLDSGRVLDGSKTYVTQEMLTHHKTRKSVWFAHEGKVYDATTYLKEHPGTLHFHACCEHTALVFPSHTIRPEPGSFA